MPDPTRKTVSATQVPALFDKSHYETRWTLYHWFRGKEANDDADGRMLWGKRMQPLILAQAADDLKLEVVPNSADIYQFREKIGCTRDAEVLAPDLGPGALETKVCFDYRQWMDRWGGGDKPPVDIELQLQAQMFVGDGKKPYNWGMICVWLAGEQHYFERRPDAAIFDLMNEHATAFLADVEDGKEPDPFGSPLEVPLLNQLYPAVTEKEPLILDDNAENTALEEELRIFAKTVEERKGAEKVEATLKAKFLALAGPHEKVMFPNGGSLLIKKAAVKGSIVTADMVGKELRKAHVRTSLIINEPSGGYVDAF